MTSVPEGQTELDRTRAEAEAGQALAQFNLGEYYAKNAEHTNAVLWYRKAAEQGSPKAQAALAACYANGRGVERDLAEAARWSQFANMQSARERKPPSAPGRSSLPPLPGGLVLRTNSPAANITNSAATSSQAGSRRVSRSQRTDALTAPESKLENITATVRPASPER